jgi:hypothetical protein
MDGRYTSETFYHMVGFSVLSDPDIALEDKQNRCFEVLKLVLNFGFIAGGGIGRSRKASSELPPTPKAT